MMRFVYPSLFFVFSRVSDVSRICSTVILLLDFKLINERIPEILCLFFEVT